MFEGSSRYSLPIMIVIALMSASIGLLSSIPLAELFISAAAIIILRKRFDVQIVIPNSLLMFIQVILGISVGATISLGELSHTLNPAVILGLVICLILQTSCSYWWLHHKEKWNPFESLLGAVPGAMAAILVISESGNKPSPRVVYSHSVRLIILIVLAGFISNTTVNVAIEHTMIGWQQWALLMGVIAVSMICGKLSLRFGIPAPYMIASLVIAAFCNSYVTTIDLSVPSFIVIFATGLLGSLIGARLAETTLREAMSYSKAGVFVTIIGLLVAAVTSYIASHLLGLSWVVVLLAWVPGSVEAMTAVALLLGLEAAFVMVNHAIRLLLLYTLPVVLKNRLEQLREQQ